MQVYKILLPINLNEALDYASDAPLQIGQLVKVPFRSGIKIGVVWGSGESALAENKIKKVIEPLPLPPISTELMRFAEWVAEYNMAPLGNILKISLSVKFGAKTFANRKNVEAPTLHFKNIPLSPDQAKVAENLVTKVAAHKYSATLLDGVTGSGKTEVYFEAIRKALEQGQQALVLLPEIGLSVQWLTRFEERFGIKPDIWHSDRTDKQRRETWLSVIENKCKIVVGARSALFLPFQKLGVIVVDEGHDQSYKQEEGTIYHGRDMAVIRALKEHIPIILVSATPSVETVNNVREGKYEMLHLPERFGSAGMPDIKVVDMRMQKLPADRFISNALKTAIEEVLADKKQVLLFLNRRGFAPLTLCRACGHRIQCPNCSAWMVWHKAKKILQCHHCGERAKLPEKCPACNEVDKLHPCGPGVERLLEEVSAYFPDSKIEVIASDSPQNTDEIINRMTNNEIDILIGTQMIAKGHHFSKLSLVGVIDADLGLEGGDLRAAERTYQLLHQVSGRAGREEDLGQVILQTYDPESIVIQAIVGQSRDEFINTELMARKRFAMPPFGKLAVIIVSGKSESDVRKYTGQLAINAPRVADAQVLGPAPAPMSFLRGQHRYRLILRAGKKFNVQKYIGAMLENNPAPSALRVKVDIDPFSFV